ncbi:hypothetical protein CHGG_01707 [Chaetomium globosum CBS 148.51]|uniref:Uncharacterized protein n=1 Tax=Chaetomium globosum (strain ATCC 6205 / CBS 148.51 / DSM 1962 / NBRC 6347 / NRRL 1970) TaxID=306901 RepID=Q2HDJ7_CHAGB|nr:uncharacterized protein CHGG_01707 [Chaetomium globosum CBS 148.51]EAQ93472.1 hypothetical protein CHGG_01707 [Chaetomium globosum CBS 148.51]
MDDRHTNPPLRGGSFADTSGYAPSLPRGTRTRTRHKRRDDAEQHQAHNRNEQAPTRNRTTTTNTTTTASRAQVQQPQPQPQASSSSSRARSRSRSRSRARARDPTSNPDSALNSDPYATPPPNGAYEAVPKDRWYNRRARVLGIPGERVREFAEGYFGLGDMPAARGAAPGSGLWGDWEEQGLVWLEGGFSEQFLWFVGQVAMQDNNAGGWDALLTKRAHRECLVTGVIGKVLEMAVFDDLLFGADKTQKSMLEAQDECTLEFEGYHRTALRSQCIRALLVNDILTPDFWPCVDQLTLQITSLLLPLLGIVDKHFPASRTNSLRNFYQDLHAIVASAGYLSIGIRWSANIFRFSLPYPGEVWDIDQEHVDDTIYNASEAANIRADLAAGEKWEAERRRRLDREREREARNGNRTLLSYGEALLASARDQLSAARRRIGGRENDGDSNNNDHTGNAWHPPSRMGKVQIVLWPMLQRFETVGEIDPEVGAADGEKVTTVHKAQVVYYYGQVDEAGGDSDHYPSLDDWMRETRRERRLSWLLELQWAIYPFMVWYLLGFLARYSPMVADIRQMVRRGSVEVFLYAAQGVTLFVMEALVIFVAVVIGVSKVAVFGLYLAMDTLAALLGPGLGYLWGALGGVVGNGDGWGGWYSPQLAYPDLSWESMKDMARVFTERFTLWDLGGAGRPEAVISGANQERLEGAQCDQGNGEQRETEHTEHSGIS